ncbi:flavodoxin family protein [Neobacillus niacini]|uniref:flavodoxin family protein n=1 Tax=Neobacillus niacini TaxID=86668 RepID=UPI0028581900|nr:flavodoxin family protein [Neobacillus niacini]MDR7002205.1 multimeric flavodoxin WrbA [Neobacillus niacini]
MSIAVIYGGTRPNGNTETLTEHGIRGLDVERIHLSDFSILPIEDARHAEGGFKDVADDYHSVIDRILQHDTLIFATPVYWYSMSGTMKNFIDRWSHSMRDAKYPDFKQQMAGKKAYVVAVGGDHPYVKALPMIQQFKHIFDFMGMEFAGYVLGEGSRPGDILKDEKALFAAEKLFV